MDTEIEHFIWAENVSEIYIPFNAQKRNLSLGDCEESQEERLNKDYIEMELESKVLNLFSRIVISLYICTTIK